MVVTHTSPDGPNGYTVTASVTDEDGTFSPAGSRAVTVNNVAPSLTLTGTGTVAEGVPVGAGGAAGAWAMVGFGAGFAGGGVWPPRMM